MIITCANCDTSYELDENLLKETGSKVRCKNCSHVFTVYPPKVLESIEPELDLELDMVVDKPQPPASEEPTIAEAADSLEETDDLDFPDIEGGLTEEDALESESSDLSADEAELNLAFDLDEEEAITGISEDQPGDDLDFLDLSDVEDMLVSDVDTGLEDIQVTEEAPELSIEDTSEADVTSENINLSEIEELLDVDKGPSLAELEKSEEQELELSSEPGFDPITGVSEDLLPDMADELDLSDIEKMLDDETSISSGPDTVKITGDEPELSFNPEEETEAPPVKEEVSEESLDLDLDMELETALADDIPAAGTEEDLSLDEALSFEEDLPLDEELTIDEDISAGEELSLDEDLNLEEDLSLEEDLVLDEEDLALDEDVAAEEDLSLDEELSLDTEALEDLDLALEAEETDKTEDLALDIEDSDFALEVEEALDLEPDEDLSLDVEEALDLESDEDLSLEEEDLQLDLESDLELELDSDEDLLLEADEEEGESLLLEEAEEGDLLLEPEDMELDLSLELDEAEDDLLLEPDEPELDLVLEPDEEEDEEGPIVEELSEDVDFELDLDELEDAAEAEQAAIPETAAAVASAEETFAMGAEEDQETAAPIAPAVPPQKKKSRALTYILLILLIICGGGYGGLYYLDQKGIKLEELPYVGTLFAKPGEIITNEATWSQTFYENADAGTLLVVTGKVENKFSHNRSYISVTGELLSANQNVVKSETVFCGNILEKSELETATLADIKKHLNKRRGDKNANMNVKPGAIVPFMVVFSDLPNNAAEFRVKIAGSEEAMK